MKPCLQILGLEKELSRLKGFPVGSHGGSCGKTFFPVESVDVGGFKNLTMLAKYENPPGVWQFAPENLPFPKGKACLPTIIFRGELLNFWGVMS